MLCDLGKTFWFFVGDVRSFLTRSGASSSWCCQCFSQETARPGNLEIPQPTLTRMNANHILYSREKD